MSTNEQAWAAACDEPPFANGTEGDGWMANWCDHCQRDAGFRAGAAGQGCELIIIALSGKRPAEWLDGPRDEHGRYSIAQQYTCVEFRAPGDGDPEPEPVPDPPGMDGLFERPAARVRMLTVDEPAQVSA